MICNKVSPYSIITWNRVALQAFVGSRVVRKFLVFQKVEGVRRSEGFLKSGGETSRSGRK
jgi:hypothetical protein